jgi:hypothetical protein
MFGMVLNMTIQLFAFAPKLSYFPLLAQNGSNAISRPHREWWNPEFKDYIPFIAIIIAIAVPVGINVWNRWSSKRLDRKNRERDAADAKERRKRDFRSATESTRAVILFKKDSELTAAHKESLPQFIEACAKIKADISDVAGFEATRDEYISLTVEGHNANQGPRPTEDKFGNYQCANVPPKVSYNRAAIERLLGKMCEYAKWSVLA